MTEIERLEEQAERTRDYSMAISILSNALFDKEAIDEEALDILEHIIYKTRSEMICECEDCGCLFTPYEH